MKQISLKSGLMYLLGIYSIQQYSKSNVPSHRGEVPFGSALVTVPIGLLGGSNGVIEWCIYVLCSVGQRLSL